MVPFVPATTPLLLLTLPQTQWLLWIISYFCISIRFFYAPFVPTTHAHASISFSSDRFSQWLQLGSNPEPHGWVFVLELSGSVFESACFEQGVPRHSGKYRVWIHSETRIYVTWQEHTVQSLQFSSVSAVYNSRVTKPSYALCMTSQTGLLTLKFLFFLFFELVTRCEKTSISF